MKIQSTEGLLQESRNKIDSAIIKAESLALTISRDEFSVIKDLLIATACQQYCLERANNITCDSRLMKIMDEIDQWYNPQENP